MTLADRIGHVPGLDVEHRPAASALGRWLGAQAPETVADLLPSGPGLRHVRVLVPLWVPDPGTRRREVRWSDRFTADEMPPGTLSVARRLHELRGEPADVAFGGGVLPLTTATALTRAIQGVVGDVPVIAHYRPQDTGPTTFTLPLSRVPLLTTPNLSGLESLETPQVLIAADGTWGWAIGEDCFAVYVAGPDAVVGAVLNDPALEADEVSPGDRVDQVWLGGEPTGPWSPPS